MQDHEIPPQRIAWNKGKLIGAKPPLRPKARLVKPDTFTDQPSKFDISHSHFGLRQNISLGDVGRIQPVPMMRLTLLAVAVLVATIPALGGCPSSRKLRNRGE